MKTKCVYIYTNRVSVVKTQITCTHKHIIIYIKQTQVLQLYSTRRDSFVLCLSAKL